MAETHNSLTLYIWSVEFMASCIASILRIHVYKCTVCYVPFIFQLIYPLSSKQIWLHHQKKRMIAKNKQTETMQRSQKQPKSTYRRNNRDIHVINNEESKCNSEGSHTNKQ